jgi:hypothetical protein
VTPPEVSAGARLVFLSLVVLLAIGFVWAVGDGSRPGGEPPAESVRWRRRAALLVLAWLGASAAVAASGALARFELRPPPLLPFLVVSSLATAALAWSSLGTRLARGLPLALLVGFQVFRVPVELWLHRMHVEGVVPVQMTFAGVNYDVLSGLSAGALALLLRAGRGTRALVLAWNLLGLSLLCVIVGVAVLSFPGPLRAFPDDPANTFVAHPPWVWLPAFLVQAAWLGHLLVFRRLELSREATLGRSA